jgi:tetratricopeptide (TPR) repeat protein
MLAVKFKPGDLQTGTISLRPLTRGEIAVMPVLMQSQRGVSREQAKALLPEARKVAAEFPTDPAVLAALAEAEFDAGEFTNAIAAANAALALDPARVNALLQKGKALFHPIRLALTGEAEGMELDLAVPFIERGSTLDPSYLRPILSAADRATAFFAELKA